MLIPRIVYTNTRPMDEFYHQDPGLHGAQLSGFVGSPLMGTRHHRPPSPAHICPMPPVRVSPPSVLRTTAPSGGDEVGAEQYSRPVILPVNSLPKCPHGVRLIRGL